MGVLFLLCNSVAQKDSRCYEKGALGQNILVDIKTLYPSLGFSVQERHGVPGASLVEGDKDD